MQVLFALLDAQMKVKQEQQCKMHSILCSLQQLQREMAGRFVVGAEFSGWPDDCNQACTAGCAGPTIRKTS
jgi:hypothetical protein